LVDVVAECSFWYFLEILQHEPDLKLLLSDTINVVLNNSDAYENKKLYKLGETHPAKSHVERVKHYFCQ